MAAVDLARLEMLRPQTMRNVVDGLRDQGLIVGVRDPIDGRRVNLMLTDDGLAWVCGQQGSVNNALARFLAERLPSDELKKVHEALDLLERSPTGDPLTPVTHSAASAQPTGALHRSPASRHEVDEAKARHGRYPTN
ncbi:MarR family winged helix-turn-helix transcriptional regulator [Nocardia asiatica]|uniref:MarR family winged helix-turn-helix transcriptional regulator n=1 Tax=Nocardia asiatica TaxID=209252 RepID=UPI003EE37777